MKDYDVTLSLKHDPLSNYASVQEARGVAQFLANQLQQPAYVVRNGVTLFTCNPTKEIEA